VSRSQRFPLGASVTIAELESDPHPAHARLREGEPVSWIPALSGWLVTTHDLANAVMRDADTFTVDDPRFSTAQVVGPSMLSLDGAEHTRHRSPFARAFRPPGVVERLGPFVKDEVARLITAMASDGSAELRRQLTGPLSVAVVARALGLSDADSATVLSWYAAIVREVSAITAGSNGSSGFHEPVDGPGASSDDARIAVAELAASVRATVTAGDPASLLAAAGNGPDGLSLPETVSNAAVLMFGGIETTDGMIANAVLHLLGYPAQLAIVRADRSLIQDAVEESLRLEPAAAVVDRYATRDIELGGASIRCGDLVTVSLAAANRDPTVFADPDLFDVRREGKRQQLAFARGPHFCLGMDLARLEARTAIEGLLDRFPGLHLDPGHPPTVSGLVFRKPDSVHVRWSEPGAEALGTERQQHAEPDS
jgi:cytochrome P450